MKRLSALILALILFLACCSAPFANVSDGHEPDKSVDVGFTSHTPANPEDFGTEDDGPEMSEPENDQPENDQPENDQPENNQPENDQPENDQPENDQPENNQPENDQPENNQPENDQPENDQPENDQPENDQLENDQPENNQPENNQPENDQPENDQPENDQPENNQPENDQPENDQPENNRPENNQPDNNQPENNQPEAPETTHDYKATVTAPTCTKGGYTTYTCTICGDSYKSDEVGTVPHNYKATVTAPTCDENGYTTYTCTMCFTYYVSNTVSATGHDWNAATTSAPKTCNTCGATEGSKLPEVTTGSGSSSAGYSEKLYVNYINVGQGDSILIKVGDCDILIDAGKESYGSTVSSYLKSQGVDDIELLINTHPDSDHCGGLTAVLNSFVVEQVWISPDTSKTSAAYTNFVSAIKSEGLTAKKPSAGTVYKYEYLTLTVLYASKGSDSNNSSIVTMLEYGSFKFLFTGDAGEEVENKLVSSGANLSCDVLKVGHHGSKTSSTAAFLSKTGADYGVICVGSNSYGHPTSDALGRLSSAGITVYRTDKNGNVVFSTNGATLTLPGGGTVSGGSGSGTSSSGSSSGSSSSGSSSSGSSSSSTEYFIGNTETKVFHLPTCGNLPAASKRNTMYNYWWIINIAGYTPCGRCLKNYSGGGTSYIANTESKVYHLSTCSYLPAASKREVIYSTAGYTPCGHCIKKSLSASDSATLGDANLLVPLSQRLTYVYVPSKQTLVGTLF